MNNGKPANHHRPLFCPICGASLLVPVESLEYPEVHRLPEHRSANGANLCAGAVITVTIDLDNCKKCGARMSKHLSGLCRRCYCEAWKPCAVSPIILDSDT